MVTSDGDAVVATCMDGAVLFAVALIVLVTTVAVGCRDGTVSFVVPFAVALLVLVTAMVDGCMIEAVPFVAAWIAFRNVNTNKIRIVIFISLDVFDLIED